MERAMDFDRAGAYEKIQKVLWVEDEALSETIPVSGVSRLAGAVYTSGRYDLTVATDPSDAMRKILADEYQVVIVDIRLPAGDDDHWIRIDAELWKQHPHSRLGIKLLEFLLGPPKVANKMLGIEVPKWVKAERFGVLTIERVLDHKDELDRLGVTICEQKTAEKPTTLLLDVIERVMTVQSRNRTARG